MENKLQNDANEEQISEAAKLQRSPLSGSARDLLGGAGSYAGRAHCPLIGLLAVPAVSKTLNPNWFQWLDQCFAW